jgi:four helix bundle protein
MGWIFQKSGGAMNKFRDLMVYAKSLALTKIVREKTTHFPRNEQFSLTAQFRRAVDSIVLNIAEGAGNSSNREFGRFLDFSIRSGFECLGCCDIALTNDYLSNRDYDELCSKFNEVIAMLYGLKKSLRQL